VKTHTLLLSLMAEEDGELGKQSQQQQQQQQQVLVGTHVPTLQQDAADPWAAAGGSSEPVVQAQVVSAAIRAGYGGSAPVATPVIGEVNALFVDYDDETAATWAPQGPPRPSMALVWKRRSVTCAVCTVCIILAVLITIDIAGFSENDVSPGPH